MMRVWLVAVLVLLAAFVAAGCGGSGGPGSTSELKAMEEHMEAANSSYLLTLAVDDVAVGAIHKAKREFERACPDGDPADLVGQAAEIAAEDDRLSFDDYKERVEGLC